MTKGSTWNIWDFHLHTPHSVLNNQFGSPDIPSTWDKYVDEIERHAAQKGIVAIGITDYFTIEGYKKLLEFQSKGRLQNILLFPNIEFRIDKVIYRSNANIEPKRINVHVLFSPEISPIEIEEGFLHDLDFIYENDTFGTAKTRKLKITNLTSFGKTLISQHQNFADSSPLKVGCLAAVVQIEQIKDTLENQFRGKYLLVLANENLGLISWDGQDHAVRKHLIQTSHALFSSIEKDRNFCLGKFHNSTEEFISEFKSLKPCLWGCDSHGYDERFLAPDLKRYCWIKGEVTWEGLKQVLFEPDERVRIQEISPEPEKSIYTLSKIDISETRVNPSIKIDNLKTELNHNLVTIIGGRGSGKTALLDLLASCFPEGEKLSDLNDSFYYRLYGNDALRRSQSNQPINTSIVFKSGESFIKNIGTDTSIFEKANILYLTQNHFDEYTENPEKLNQHIIDLVFEKYIEEKFLFNDIKNKINENEQTIQSINLELQQLREYIDGKKLAEEANLQIKEGEKVDYLERISLVEQKQGKDDGVIQQLTEKLDALKSKKRNLNQLIEKLSNFSKEVSDFISSYEYDAVGLNSEFQLISNDAIRIFPNKLYELPVVLEIINNNNDELAKINIATDGLIISQDKEINDLQGVDKLIADFRQKVSGVNSEIEAINTRILEIIEIENRISTLEIKRIDTYVEIIKSVVQLKVFLQTMIDKFDGEEDEMLKNLKFSAVVDIRQSKKVIENLVQKINRQSVSEDELSDSLMAIFNQINQMMNSNEQDNVIIDYKTPVIELSNYAANLKRRRATTESDLYNTILNPFFGIGLKIEFNNRELINLSMGERAIVLLKILLSLDDKPLLIDQPEEHLDNRYIYDELSPAFRSAKKRRQIIIATHNANLVVNTDAEQIIVAENANGTLSYKVGSLEDLGIRESIKRILEGGDEAFKKREEKYGLKF